MEALGVTRCGSRVFHWGRRTYIMGVLNLTPDSFSGDGLAYDVEGAVARALALEDEGADIVDVGGESTRPGSTPVPEEEELRRVLPVLERLSSRLSIPISIDTYKAPVAEQAVAAGASMINDVWGLRKDFRLAAVAARYHVPLVLVHNQEGTTYRDLVPDILRELHQTMEKAMQAGVPRENIILDPGFGFGKTPLQNLEMLRRLEEFHALGRPLLVGTSRKSFIGAALGGLPPGERLEGTLATVTWAVSRGAHMVRVHDVKAVRRAVKMTEALLGRQGPL